MNLIRTLIIEDEEPARDLVTKFLSDFDEIELVGSCTDGFNGLKSINEHKPDLIILDIQMPKLSGFELLELLDELPEIIFTTAYDQYAIQAFEKNAVDYLMKPFSKARLRQAVDKVIERLKRQKNSQTDLKRFVETLQSNTENITRIVVKKGSSIHVIPVEDIVQIESEDDYVFIYTMNERFMKKETLRFFEQQLPSNQFIRVHRSHLVCIDKIEKIEQYGRESFLLRLKNENLVKVSKSHIKNLKQALNF